MVKARFLVFAALVAILTSPLFSALVMASESHGSP
jgi:hypothetical protein